ncbi:MAG: hypothetical protein AB7I48_29190 [Planctomycetaceae bacterium]
MHKLAAALRILSPLLVTVTFLVCGFARLCVGSDAADVIRRAGNAEDERERYRLLSELFERPDISPMLKADLERLLPIIDQWANGKDQPVPASDRAAENGYLCGFFHRQTEPGGDFPPRVAEDSPLYPIWCFYRGRMLAWKPVQTGHLLRSDETRLPYHDEAHRLLVTAGEAFPENRILAMYNGRAIPWEIEFAPDPQAPQWANAQREAVEKLADLIHWWIDERQLEDGQFGGGWGDDVEMWRFWTPLLIGFDDPQIAAAQERISNGLFALPRMQSGYTSLMDDVEHTAEDSADSILPMMHLRPDDPQWQARALRIADLMRDQWTGRNERGLLQFQSTFFNVNEVDLTPQRACDTVYHPRVMQPAMLYWQRTGDAGIGRLMSDWMTTWVDAAARYERGKPAGIIPTAIHWPDGRVGGLGDDWWHPENYGTDLYTWPSAMSLMTSSLLLTYHMTGDAKFLKPIHSMAQLRAEYLAHPPEQPPAPGTKVWCASQMGRFLSDTLAKYRQLTGDTQYDHLLQADASGYVRYQLTGDLDDVVADFENDAAAFRSNKPGYTSEMRYTDRVLTYNDRWFNYWTDKPLPSPRLQSVYSALTGDPGSPLLFPMNAVRWHTPPREFAALVTDSGPARLAARVYHLGPEPRSLVAELFLLKPGAYVWTLQQVGATDPPDEHRLTVSGPRAEIPLTIPPQQECRLLIEPAE